MDDDLLRVAAAGEQRHRAIADVPAADVRSDLDHLARAFQAEDRGGAGRRRIVAFALEQIGAIHRRRAHANAQFVGRQRRRIHVTDAKTFVAEFIDMTMARMSACVSVSSRRPMAGRHRLPQSAQVLRRRESGRRTRSVRRQRRVLRPARSERRGQDDDDRDPRRADQARLRRRRDPRPRPGARTSASCASASASRCRKRSSPRSSPSSRRCGCSARFIATGTIPRSCCAISRSTRSATRASASSPAASGSGSAVACALVGDPDVLFLDEPTTGLDPQSRLQLWDIVQRFRAEGRDGAADDALHGGGGAPLRPRGHRRSRPPHRPRHAARS